MPATVTAVTAVPLLSIRCDANAAPSAVAVVGRVGVPLVGDLANLGVPVKQGGLAINVPTAALNINVSTAGLGLTIPTTTTEIDT